jgi:hypothetical protein
LAKKGVARREIICEFFDFRGDAMSRVIFKMCEKKAKNTEAAKSVTDDLFY